MRPLSVHRDARGAAFGLVRRGAGADATSTCDVAAGEVVTLVGRNGAGKTTLLRCVMGLHRQVEGTVDLRRRATSPSARPHRRARAGLGWVPDDRGIYASLTVAENLTLPPGRRRPDAWPLERVYESFPVLHERRDFPGTKLSGGEQQMLAHGPGAADGRPAAAAATSPPRAWPPSSSSASARSSARSRRTGSPCCSSSRTCTSPPPSPTGTTCSPQGRVVESLDNADFRPRETRTARLPRHLDPRQPTRATPPGTARTVGHRHPRRGHAQPTVRAMAIAVGVARARRVRRRRPRSRAASEAHRRQGRARSCSTTSPASTRTCPARTRSGRDPDGHRRLQGEVRRQGRHQEHRGRHGRPPEQAGHRQHQGPGDVRPQKADIILDVPDLVRGARRRHAGARRRRSSTSTSAPATTDADRRAAATSTRSTGPTTPTCWPTAPASAVTEAGGKNWYIVYPDYAFGQDMTKASPRRSRRPAARSSASDPTPFPQRQLLHLPAQGAEPEPEAGRARHDAGRRRPGQRRQAVQPVQAAGQGHRPRRRA